MRILSNGSVLVNDVARRQLVLLDNGLKLIRVIADTTPSTDRTYTSALGGLVAFRADSSLFVDPRSLSMLVIDPKGAVVRVMAVPYPTDASYMIGGPFGAPGIDSSGRLVYRGPAESQGAMRSLPNLDSMRTTALTDSAPIYRVSLVTRERQLIGYVRTPRQIPSARLDNAGKFVGMKTLTNPMPVVDDWALLPDGRVAIVRGADFHVDWIEPDGRMTSSSRVPFNWEPLSEAGRIAFLDSARAEADKAREALKKMVERDPVARAPGVMVVATGADDRGGAPKLDALVPVVDFIDASAMPDYRPAFRMGATRVDEEGNLWVRTTEPSDSGSIYMVINGKGELVDRVKLSVGRVIAGFGGSRVYLAFLSDSGARLEVIARR